MRDTILKLPALIAAAIVGGALLGGCASTGAKLADAPVAAYRDSIALSGHLAVNYHKDGQPESVTGKFNWVQTPARIDVSLDSPTGQTIATIAVTPASATLIQAGQAPRVARDIDSLSAQTLGWALPVSGLRDWLQGYAVAADGQRFVASPQHDSVITRDGWRLRFVSWQDGAPEHPRPKRIDAERNTSVAADELAIRIAIDPQD
jgi:outer membrane lipoprotein LolB